MTVVFHAQESRSENAENENQDFSKDESLNKDDKLKTKEKFGFFVSKTFPKVYGLAYRLAGDKDDAQDIAQEAYLRAFQSFEKFRNESSFETWIYRVASNCAYSYLVKRNKTPGLYSNLESIAGVTESPEELVSRKSQHSELLQAVSQLSYDLKIVVTLKDIYGLSHSEIASRLNISRTAAKVRLHRARKALKDFLMAKGYFKETL